MTTGLEIYYGDILVGVFGLTSQADYYIEYAEGWQQRGFPVSVHLPLSQARHEGRQVEYFIENLLPEAELRRAIARRHGISENNYFSMMQAIGRDCAGAFSLGGAQSAGRYEQLDTPQLRELLQSLPQYPLAVNRQGASFSLAGAQNKIPLHKRGTVFELPLAGAASNCIIKTPMQHARHSVLNELFCMQLAQRVLGDVANTEYLFLDDVSSLVVHRYDRVVEGHQLKRIPQEDFCQLSALPSRLKYESEGGPGFSECARIIRTYCSIPARELLRMLKWSVFNLCIGNMDAHAKNLSVLTSGTQKNLAPFYDLISTLYYEEFSQELAMSIGGRRNPDKIGSTQWLRFAEDIGLPVAIVQQQVRYVINRTIDALPLTAEALMAKLPHTAFIADLKKFILNRCILVQRKLQ